MSIVDVITDAVLDGAGHGRRESPTTTSGANALLLRLSPEVMEGLRPHLSRVELSVGDTIAYAVSRSAPCASWKAGAPGSRTC